MKITVRNSNYLLKNNFHQGYLMFCFHLNFNLFKKIKIYLKQSPKMSKSILINLNFNSIRLFSQHELIHNPSHFVFHHDNQLYLLILKMMFHRQLTAHPHYANCKILSSPFHKHFMIYVLIFIFHYYCTRLQSILQFYSCFHYCCLG